MSLFTMSSVLFMMAVQLLVARATTIKPVVISKPNDACLSKETRDILVQNFKASVQGKLEDTYTKNPNCGPGPWVQVAYLNMTDPLQQCPSAWREYNTSGVRFCRRPVTSSGSCPGISYTTGRWYCKVCGRAIGYQIGSTEAFGYNAVGQPINSYYVYGVSITHGRPRNHIWTFAGGFSELSQSSNCPCNVPNSQYSHSPPSFVGSNYYCESGNPGKIGLGDHLYTNDPLWDGQQCEGQCCSNGKSPPWFNVDLPTTTADYIEVHICSAYGGHDDIGLQLLEIYIQ